ncbi:hypothetical protein MTO96_020210 [Rhipicephalus appendiculatus]
MATHIFDFQHCTSILSSASSLYIFASSEHAFFLADEQQPYPLPSLGALRSFDQNPAVSRRLPILTGFKMAHNDLSLLHSFLRKLSANQLRSLNNFNHAWLPELQYTEPEQLASAICTSIDPIHFDSQEEFLEKLAWMYCWLIPLSVHSFPWKLYRRNGPPDAVRRHHSSPPFHYPHCFSRLPHDACDDHLHVRSIQLRHHY